MKSEKSLITHARTRFAFRLGILPGCLLLGLLAGDLHATPVPKNLGNGLDKLVESNLTLKAEAQTRGLKGGQRAIGAYNGYATEHAAKFAAASLGDDQGRLLVRVNFDGRLSVKDTIASLTAKIGSLTVTAVDEKYRGVGVMNALVSVDDVPQLANIRGVRAVILELKPRHNRPASAERPVVAPVVDATNGQVLNKLGTAFDQGVTQHRVDVINRFYNGLSTGLDYQGSGMSIGFLSDSYNTAFASGNAREAAARVTAFDLPGAANNPVNTQPVVVLQDFPGGTDEGRAMVEIGYKMAPKARLAFASADFGEVGFANNIRALAGLSGFTYPAGTQQGFAAQVICDDVGYFDEPFFQDGIIGNAVDDVFAAGVSYFSSAANDIGVNGYDSDLRWVANGTGLTAAAGNTALAGTNIDLTGVPANLYAGGFHNFNPNPGQLDVAQLVNIQSNANQPDTILQWDEPYDQNTAPILDQPALFSGSGTITSTTTTVTFTVPAQLNQGTLYEIDAKAASGSSVDVTVTVKDPNGNTIISQDNTVDEVVHFRAPVTGSGYQIIIGRFSTTTGAFTVDLYSSTQGYPVVNVQTDINLLVFRADTGAYIATSSLTADNFATNQPIELGFTLRPTGQTQLQYVIARSNVPANGGATHVRYLIPGNGLSGLGPAEYFTYNTVTTAGHAMAAGCNGTAAYDVFRPNIPESFTSPGPVRIYFDKQGNRLATPEIRLQPRVAAADDANNSFFSGDGTADPDTSRNFSGTSAAAPHAAGVATLVLEAHGGPGSVTPTQMRTILQTTAFPHDLDPSSSSGRAVVTGGSTGSGKVTITINSDQSTNGGTGGNDNNSIAVSYVGGSSLATLVFNPQGTAATAGNPTGGSNGDAYTGSATVGGTVTYFENDFPGMVFAPGTKAFTIGSGSTITAANAVASYSNLAPAPSNGTTQVWTMTLTFTPGTFTGGNVLRYNVGRAIQHSAVTGTTVPPAVPAGTTATNYSADLLGGGVFIPRGTVVNNGMTFSGTTADGGTFSGVIVNRIGAGYSVLDGYGFLNAEAAVSAPLP